MPAHSTKPIRVAMVITELDSGGAERALVDLVTRLDRRDFECSVLALGPPPARVELVARLTEAGARPTFLGGSRWWHLPRVLRRLAKNLRQIRPDIVQTFLVHANVAGALAARRAGVERVVGGIRVAEHERRWHLWAARLVDRWVDRYVCVSNDVATFSMQHGLPASKIVTIPNGVDLARIDAAPAANVHELTGGSATRALALVGRLERQKGFDWLLAFAPKLLGELPEHAILVVGEGPMRSHLERMVESSGIRQRVRFLGWRTDVPGILKASDALLLPSRWEGMPNVVLEAMACRCPVVAVDVEGVRELLGEASSEHIAERTPEAFSDATVALVSNPARRAALADANRQRVEQQFDIRGTARAYARLYQELAAPG